MCTTGTYGNFNYDQATQKWTWTCSGEAGSTPVYSGFNLNSGQQGVLLMTGRVLNTNPDNRTNRVGIYENNYLWDYDTEPYQPAPRALHIEKTVDKPQVFSGEIVEFTIKVSNTEGRFT